MQRISDFAPGILHDLDDRRRAYRARMIEAYGWPETVHCVLCGDFGYQPEDGADCLACETGRERAEEAERAARWQAHVPARFRDYTLDGHPHAEAVTQARAWLDDGADRGQNLLLVGATGTGKTGLGIALLRERYLAGRTITYGTVPDLLDRLRPGASDDGPLTGMRDLQRVGVLLMDDLGTEKASEWQAERLYLIVNGRYEREGPTIITTNRTVPELRDLMGERLISRLTEDVTFVHVDGPDRRQQGPQPALERSYRARLRRNDRNTG